MKKQWLLFSLVSIFLVFNGCGSRKTLLTPQDNERFDLSPGRQLIITPVDNDCTGLTIQFRNPIPTELTCGSGCPLYCNVNYPQQGQGGFNNNGRKTCCGNNPCIGTIILLEEGAAGGDAEEGAPPAPPQPLDVRTINIYSVDTTSFGGYNPCQNF